MSAVCLGLPNDRPQGKKGSWNLQRALEHRLPCESSTRMGSPPCQPSCELFPSSARLAQINNILPLTKGKL
eukprot:scaffold177247_cov18-Tisochrysis_lutea.AAC.1